MSAASSQSQSLFLGAAPAATAAAAPVVPRQGDGWTTLSEGSPAPGDIEMIVDGTAASDDDRPAGTPVPPPVLPAAKRGTYAAVVERAQKDASGLPRESQKRIMASRLTHRTGSGSVPADEEEDDKDQSGTLTLDKNPLDQGEFGDAASSSSAASTPQGPARHTEVGRSKASSSARASASANKAKNGSKAKQGGKKAERCSEASPSVASFVGRQSRDALAPVSAAAAPSVRMTVTTTAVATAAGELDGDEPDSAMVDRVPTAAGVPAPTAGVAGPYHCGSSVAGASAGVGATAAPSPLLANQQQQQRQRSQQRPQQRPQHHSRPRPQQRGRSKHSERHSEGAPRPRSSMVAPAAAAAAAAAAAEAPAVPAADDPTQREYERARRIAEIELIMQRIAELEASVRARDAALQQSNAMVRRLTGHHLDGTQQEDILVRTHENKYIKNPTKHQTRRKQRGQVAAQIAAVEENILQQADTLAQLRIEYNCLLKQIRRDEHSVVRKKQEEEERLIENERAARETAEKQRAKKQKEFAKAEAQAAEAAARGSRARLLTSDTHAVASTGVMTAADTIGHGAMLTLGFGGFSQSSLPPPPLLPLPQSSSPPVAAFASPSAFAPSAFMPSAAATSPFAPSTAAAAAVATPTREGRLRQRHHRRRNVRSFIDDGAIESDGNGGDVTNDDDDEEDEEDEYDYNDGFLVPDDDDDREEEVEEKEAEEEEEEEEEEGEEDGQDGVDTADEECADNRTEGH